MTNSCIGNGADCWYYSSKRQHACNNCGMFMLPECGPGGDASVFGVHKKTYLCPPCFTADYAKKNSAKGKCTPPPPEGHDANHVWDKGGV